MEQALAKLPPCLLSWTTLGPFASSSRLESVFSVSGGEMGVDVTVPPELPRLRDTIINQKASQGWCVPLGVQDEYGC